MRNERRASQRACAAAEQLSTEWRTRRDDGSQRLRHNFRSKQRSKLHMNKTTLAMSVRCCVCLCMICLYT